MALDIVNVGQDDRWFRPSSRSECGGFETLSYRLRHTDFHNHRNRFECGTDTDLKGVP